MKLTFKDNQVVDVDGKLTLTNQQFLTKWNSFEKNLTTWIKTIKNHLKWKDLRFQTSKLTEFSHGGFEDPWWVQFDGSTLSHDFDDEDDWSYHQGQCYDFNNQYLNLIDQSHNNKEIKDFNNCKDTFNCQILELIRYVEKQ